MCGKIAFVRAETTRHDVVSARTIALLTPFRGLTRAMRIVLACVENSECRDEECYRAYCAVKTFERGYCLDKTKRSYEDRSERRFHNGVESIDKHK